MTREEFVQRLIMNSMSDDFENVDRVIFRDVAGVAAARGLTVERPEVVQNLRELVEGELVHANDLSATTGDPFTAALDKAPAAARHPRRVFQDVFLSNPEGLGLAQVRSNVVAA